MLLTGTGGEGVANASLGNAALVSAAFNANFNITASNGEDALLVVNDTNGNGFSVWQWVQAGGGETSAERADAGGHLQRQRHGDGRQLRLRLRPGRWRPPLGEIGFRRSPASSSPLPSCASTSSELPAHKRRSREARDRTWTKTDTDVASRAGVAYSAPSIRGCHMTDNAELERAIEAVWEKRDEVSPETGGEERAAIETTLETLDKGALRAAERQADGRWRVNQWAKKAVLLGFRLAGHGRRRRAGRRAAAGGTRSTRSSRAGPSTTGAPGLPRRGGPVVRRSAYIAPGVVLMPSFVNVGAYVGEETMVDTWATVGSCAQIGRNVHLSGGVGIGGVLEPLQAEPTIIEDDCFIGAPLRGGRGLLVREGSVLGMGVFIGKSTKIVDRATGEIFYGEVPPYSVVVAGSLPGKPFPNGSRAGPLLRGHRQAGGRADAVEDGDQRSASGLNASGPAASGPAAASSGGSGSKSRIRAARSGSATRRAAFPGENHFERRCPVSGYLLHHGVDFHREHPHGAGKLAAGIERLDASGRRRCCGRAISPGARPPRRPRGRRPAPRCACASANPWGSPSGRCRGW